MKYSLFFLILIIVFTLTPFNTINGYTETTKNGTLVAKVSPERPIPNGEVSISLSGYGYNLNRSSINWVVNGTDLTPAKNKTKYSIKLGATGTVTNIEIIVTLNNKQTITKTLTFYPAEVDILWESNSYTPPFYEGASLPSVESEITFLALPKLTNENSQPISNEKIEYTWFKDGQKLTNKSGVGQNTLNLSINRFTNEVNMSLIAEAINDTFEAEQKITIPVYQPKIIIYEVKPLLGVDYNKELKNKISLNSDQIVLRVEPYHLAPQKLIKNTLEFIWSLNNNPLPNSGINSRVIALQKPEDVSGEASISVLIKNTLNQFEQFKKDLVIEFSKSTINF